MARRTGVERATRRRERRDEKRLLGSGLEFLAAAQGRALVRLTECAVVRIVAAGRRDFDVEITHVVERADGKVHAFDCDDKRRADVQRDLVRVERERRCGAERLQFSR